MGYGQPVIYKAGGVRQLIIGHPRVLSSLDPETGRVYWEQECEVGGNMTVWMPVASGPYLMVAQFFNRSMMLRLDADQPVASLLWQGQSRSELPDRIDTLHSLITTSVTNNRS